MEFMTISFNERTARDTIFMELYVFYNSCYYGISIKDVLNILERSGIDHQVYFDKETFGPDMTRYGWKTFTDYIIKKDHIDGKASIVFEYPEVLSIICSDINDSGKRMSYGDGKAVREPSTGKGRFDLITPFGLNRIARWYELGAQKYSDRNWEKGMPYSRYVDSAFRHLTKYMMGCEDEDHLAAACWNLMAIMHHEAFEESESLDDLPHYWSGRKING